MEVRKCSQETENESFYRRKVRGRDKSIFLEDDAKISFDTKTERIKFFPFLFMDENSPYIHIDEFKNEIDVLREEFESRGLEKPPQFNILEEKVEHYEDCLNRDTSELTLQDLRDLITGKVNNHKRYVELILTFGNTDNSEEVRYIYRTIQEIGWNNEHCYARTNDEYLIIQFGEANQEPSRKFSIGKDSSQRNNIFVHEIDVREHRGLSQLPLREVADIMNEFRIDSQFRERNINSFHMPDAQETKRLMGYHSEYILDEEIKDAERHRIQGDLYIQRQCGGDVIYDNLTLAEMVKIYLDSDVGIEKNSVMIDIKGDRDFNIRPVPRRTATSITNLSNFYDRLRNDESIRFTTATDREIADACRTMGHQLRNIVDRKKIEVGEMSDSVDWVMDWVSEGEEIPEPDTIDYKTIDRDNIKNRMKNKTTEKMRIPIDNHLIIIEDGFEYPLDYPDENEEPVRVAVPEKTTMQIWHAEHDNIETELEAGVYKFGLLHRGEWVWNIPKQ